MERYQLNPHHAGMNMETDWVKVGTSGATVDGRNIKEQWLTDMADSYDADNEYKAQIWAWSHYNHFATYGKVTAVKTAKDSKGRLSLYVKLSPLPELVVLNRQGQLQHASMEINLNYKGEGKAYLTGLLLTNDPASIGTEEIHFSTQHDSTGKVYSTPLSFKAVMPDDEVPGWFTRFLKSFTVSPKAADTSPETDAMTPDQFAKMEANFTAQKAELEARNSELLTKMQELLAKQGEGAGDSAAVDTLKADVTAKDAQIVALTTERDTLKAEVEALKKPDPSKNTPPKENFGVADEWDYDY